MRKFSVFGLTVLFLTVMVMGVLAGGGGQSAASGAGDNFNLTGMPIVNTPVRLTALTMRWADMDDSFLQNNWMVELERRSNVIIDWQVESATGWSERRSILLASGTLPDMIIGNATFGDTQVLTNLDFFLPLDDLIEMYMPNLRNSMEAIPSLRRVVTYPDGRI